MILYEFTMLEEISKKKLATGFAGLAGAAGTGYGLYKAYKLGDEEYDTAKEFGLKSLELTSKIFPGDKEDYEKLKDYDPGILKKIKLGLKTYMDSFKHGDESAKVKYTYKAAKDIDRYLKSK